MSGERDKSNINRFKRKIAQCKKLCLDSSCFIYQLSNHPRFAALTDELFSFIETGQTKGITSTISVIEVFVRPEKEKNWQLIKNYEGLFLNFPHLEIIPLDWDLARLTAQIRAKYSLRTPDCIQLALAQNEQADAFITNDKKLKRLKEVEVLILEDFL